MPFHDFLVTHHFFVRSLRHPLVTHLAHPLSILSTPVPCQAFCCTTQKHAQSPLRVKDPRLFVLLSQSTRDWVIYKEQNLNFSGKFKIDQCLGGACPLLQDGALCTCWLKGQKGMGRAKGPGRFLKPLTGTLILLLRAPPSWPHHLPKVHLLIPQRRADLPT
jgi:hypothetical protein